MSLNIRHARTEDAELIYQFVTELAEYENLSHEVLATEADIRQTLFGLQPRAYCYIAEWEGRPAGFALYFYNYSTFVGRNGIYLEDIYVRPEFRGKGVGKELLARIAAKAVKENCGRLEWAVLDWNQPAINFYESLSARSINGWTTYRLTGRHLKELAGLV